MLYFCKYKNMLGEPNKGMRNKYRIMNISLIDVGATILLAKAIQYYIVPEMNIWIILLFLFVLGVLMHRLFCVKTTIDKFLFG